MDYDKELIRQRAGELVAHYVHTSVVSDKHNRTIWRCPECGKDKLSLQKSTGVVGCWNESCPIPRTNSPAGLIANFEGLDPQKDYRAALAKSYQILGIDVEESSRQEQQKDTGASQKRSEEQSRLGGTSKLSGCSTEDEEAPEHRSQKPSRRGERRSSGDGSSQARSPDSSPGWRSGRPATPQPPPEDALPPLASEDLSSAVFEMLLKMCLPVGRDIQFWRARGVDPQTVIDGGFGSMSHKRCTEVVARLEKIFGAHTLTTVPGFWRDRQGKLRFTLDGDYALIPYHDFHGKVRTIEGRKVGPDVPSGNGKYVSLLRGGSHLYVYPGFSSEELVAFCEGPIGAIVAAQEGIAVGAIQGYQRYRKSGEMAVLPELEGVDFGGRTLVYIPDLDVKPEVREGVEKEAPEAARWLIEEAGGEARIARLLEEQGAKDLDEWLLAIEGEHRRRRFEELLSTAVSPEQWREAIISQRPPEQTTATAHDAGEESGQGSEGSPVQQESGGEQSTDYAPGAGDGGEGSLQDCQLGVGGDPEHEKSSSQDSSPELSLANQRREGDSREIVPSGHSSQPAAAATGAKEAENGEDLAVTAEPPETLRWRALIEEEEGPEQPGCAVAYYPRDGALELPPECFLTPEESSKAAGYGVMGAICWWVICALWSGWLGELPAWMPQPPWPVVLAGGVLLALVMGSVVAALAALMISGSRRALRRHLLGEDRENA